jgi:5'-3' exonuclease
MVLLFIGYQFLPDAYSFLQGAIDLLMAVYKKEFVKMGGYLTNSFKVEFLLVLCVVCLPDANVNMESNN